MKKSCTLLVFCFLKIGFFSLPALAQWQVFNPVNTAYAISAFSDKIAVAGGGSDIFYTQDGGDTWNRSTIFVAEESGSYRVQIQTTFGCSSTYQPFLFTSGQSLFNQRDDLFLFPNPANGDSFFIRIQAENPLVEVKLISTLGQKREVSFLNLDNGWVQVDRIGIPSGTYVVLNRFEDGKTVYKRLVLK